MAKVPPAEVIQENLRKGLVLNSSADNYLDWIFQLCQPYLTGKILEIGAGRGDFTSRFRELGHVTATELSEEALKFLRDRFEDDPRVTIQPFDIFADTSQQFDTIVMINVLEHIEKDSLALESLQRHLAPGGALIVYVPAFWALYSEFDNSIGHYRRYTKREMVWLADQVGLRTSEARYVNAIGAIGWFFLCRVLKRDASEGASVGIMNKVIIPIMRKIEHRIQMPFGISVFYVGRFE